MIDSKGELDVTKIDIWSLGVMTRYLLTGERYDHTKKSQSEYPHWVDKKLINLINLCLTINPINRSNSQDLVSHDFFTQQGFKSKFELDKIKLTQKDIDRSITKIMETTLFASVNMIKWAKRTKIRRKQSGFGKQIDHSSSEFSKNLNK